MDHNELLDIVDDVLAGPMSDASMKRALSTLYYAMFHFLAKSNADMLAGQAVGRSFWTMVYRSLDHGKARDRCGAAVSNNQFSVNITDFARMFQTMQQRRHLADYNPDWLTTTAQVNSDRNDVRDRIARFGAVQQEERREFAIHLLFGRRT
jgi:hypothetical protein